MGQFLLWSLAAVGALLAVLFLAACVLWICAYLWVLREPFRHCACGAFELLPGIKVAYHDVLHEEHLCQPSRERIFGNGAP